MDRGNKATNIVDQEVSDHGFNDGLKEGTVGQASITSGDVPSSSNSTIGWTEGTTTINVTNSDDVSIVSPNPSGSSNVQTGIPTVNTGPIPLPSSYTTKLSSTSLTKANLWKLEVNAPNDANYDIWLPLASVHKVNDRMKNSLYGYFIGKRLSFPVVECNSFEALNAASPIIEEVASIKATTSSMQEERQRSTPLVERINVGTQNHFHFIIETRKNKMRGIGRIGNLVLVDDDGKPVEKVDYPGNMGSEDEVEQDENETTNYLASKPKRVGYGLKIFDIPLLYVSNK
ncbi:hypothetical protein Tco_1525563 [Tanacetum coccineum]